MSITTYHNKILGYTLGCQKTKQFSLHFEILNYFILNFFMQFFYLVTTNNYQIPANNKMSFFKPSVFEKKHGPTILRDFFYALQCNENIDCLTTIPKI